MRPTGGRMRDDHHRARRVVSALLPDRPEQEAAEAAEAARADDEQLPVRRLRDQRLGRLALADDRGDLDPLESTSLSAPSSTPLASRSYAAGSIVSCMKPELYAPMGTCQALTALILPPRIRASSRANLS